MQRLITDQVQSVCFYSQMGHLYYPSIQSSATIIEETGKITKVGDWRGPERNNVLDTKYYHNNELIATVVTCTRTVQDEVDTPAQRGEPLLSSS